MNPPGLPLPPTDPTRLAEFPVVPKEQLPNVLWRIYKVANEAEYFSDRGYGRWDPLAGSLELYGTCYTSTHPMGAYVEAFAEVRSLTQDDINRYALATIELPPEPRWANMVDPTIVGQWELDERISVGDDYDTCQRWGEALFAVGFTGIHYGPRHNVGGAWRPSVALFGNPGYQPTQLRVLDSTPIPPELVTTAWMSFGIEVWPSTPLGPS